MEIIIFVYVSLTYMILLIVSSLSSSTRCKIWFTLWLFGNYFSLKSLSLSLKSHMSMGSKVN